VCVCVCVCVRVMYINCMLQKFRTSSAADIIQRRWKLNDRSRGNGGVLLAGTELPVLVATTSLTWTGLGSNPSLRGESVPTDRRSRGTAVAACTGGRHILVGTFIHHKI
jgi:hypothetical protein